MEENKAIMEKVFGGRFEPEKDEHTFIRMSDRDHGFAVALSDMLQILLFAEGQGEIPPLPSEWWSRMADTYRGRKTGDVPKTCNAKERGI